MFNKIRNRLYIKREFKVSVEQLILEIKEIRKHHKILAICPKPTENSWRGVLTATIGLFAFNTFQLPQYFSNALYRVDELEQLCNTILDLNFEKIVFSGYLPYFESLIKYLHDSSFLEIYLIYHGSFSSNREDKITTKMLYDIIRLNKEKKIKRIGFVKKGMSESFFKIASIEAIHVRLITSTPENLIKFDFEEDKQHIGIFTHDQYRKNIDNQIAASLMFDNSLIHIRRNYGFEYFFSENRFRYHPYFSNYAEFLNLLGSMDINMYVSFSECFGQIITESLALGVPCLAAENSGVFDFSQELRELLVVNEFDNSNAIYKQANLAIENKDLISKMGKKYVQELNVQAKISLEDFLK